MTASHRRVLEKFAADDVLLCKAIAAALAEIDQLRAEVRDMAERRLRDLTRREETTT